MDDLTIAIGVLALVFLVGGGIYLFMLISIARNLHALGDMTWREAFAFAREELK